MFAFGDILFGFFTYLLIWWVTFYLVLPFGNTPNQAQQDGTQPGAPKHHGMGRKFFINTIFALVLWIVGWFLWWFWGETIMAWIRYSVPLG